MIKIFMENGSILTFDYSDIKISDSEIRVIYFGSLMFYAKLSHIKYLYEEAK